MRPRVFPAEDFRRKSIFLYQRQRCFNEAAGIPRGRRARPVLVRCVVCLASMRPRVFPAEDVVSSMGV